MKSNKLVAIIAYLFSTVFLLSCSSTNMLTLNVTEPAIVYVPTKIKKIGIINRSKPTDKNTNIDKADKILSLEGKNLDRDAAKSAIIGLQEELNNFKLFSEVKIIDSIDLRSPGIGVFPSTLTWDYITQLCNTYNVDAIFELSFYDTEAKIDYQVVPIQIDGPLGVKIPAVENHATITTLIKTGWRVYDPINKIVQDEFAINKTIFSKGVGINPMKAVEAILGRKEAVIQESKYIGKDYAARILPYKIVVSRDYYVRGTDNFKIGKRRAQTGDWDGAAELWKLETTNSKTKIAGRACFNMAIINEINGNLDEAVKWASKSYTDYNNKNALRYNNILKYRIQRNNQLKQETK